MMNFSTKQLIDSKAEILSVAESVGISGSVDDELLVLPGFCDVHVHFREPGFSYKETIGSGCRSAARGGYTAVCTMPNLMPVPDSTDHLAVSLSAIERQATIDVFPYGALTVGEQGLTGADLEGMAGRVIGFSDDGRGVQSEDMMHSLMVRAVRLGKIISAHCEDNSMLRGGVIHDGSYARAHGYPGICSESEWGPIERDLYLAEKTGCAYHVCHISTAESVDLIRQAKKRGVNVTCETAPHYLLLCEDDLQEDGRFKMNPPLRGRRDREALLEGIDDGTIDMIATDHAPHSAEEKSRGLRGSPFGVVGLETAFPALYTGLVMPGRITLDRLVDLLANHPRKRFNIPQKGFSIWRVSEEKRVDPDEFLSMGRASPFAGRSFFGVNLLTALNRTVIYCQKN